MPGDDGPPGVDDLDPILRMTARLGAARRTDPCAVERTLEAGLGALVGLEAELARVRRRAGADPAARRAATRPLQTRIIDVRDALTELRTLSALQGQSRIGYGFVLPRDGPAPHAHPN